MHCFQLLDSVRLEFELAISFKRAEEKKMSLCRINLLSLFCLCYFFLSQNNEKGKKGKLNVEMFQAIMESAVVYQFVPLESLKLTVDTDVYHVVASL